MRVEEEQLIATRRLLLRVGELQVEAALRLDKTNELLERQAALVEELLGEVRDLHRKV